MGRPKPNAAVGLAEGGQVMSSGWGPIDCRAMIKQRAEMERWAKEFEPVEWPVSDDEKQKGVPQSLPLKLIDKSATDVT